jgi:hypothetical protein
MMTNMAILEREKALALSNPTFIENHELREYAVWFQVGVTLIIFSISVLKPWKKKKTASKKSCCLKNWGLALLIQPYFIKFN